MNRYGDCICAIPGKPPEEHNPQCPIRLRAEAFDALARVTFGVDPGIRRMGAGADQAPGHAQDARPGAPARARAPELRLVEPSPPNQPLAFTGRFHVADRRGERCEVCGLVLRSLESLPGPLQQNCPGGPRRGGP